jgi:polyphenol oxidase
MDAGRLTTVKQVHGNNIAEIAETRAGAGADGDSNIEADALMTSLSDTPIAICTADCVPVILADMETRNICVVHAGWKGIYSLIVPMAIAALEGAAQGETANVYAFIGPAIGPCCYEVDGTRAELFDQRYVIREAGKIRLDLPAIIRDQLGQAGLDAEKIADSGMCTCCRKDLFYSFRRDGICGRQMAAAALM